MFLHDRKVGQANIDHLIVASSRVWVVDAKNYAGRVEYRGVGGWLRPADYRIYVGGRDKTKLATRSGGRSPRFGGRWATGSPHPPRALLHLLGLGLVR